LRFSNPNPEHRPASFAAVLRWGVIDRLLGRREVRPPGPPAPRVEPDRRKILEPGGPDRLTWIGHASFLGTLGGGSFLVDPVFSPRIGWLVPRHGRPGIEVTDLPRVDAILVTHCHYDHLDEPSMLALSREVPVVVPLRLGRWFERRGFRRVVELDWWQGLALGTLRVTLVPARHWSRRGLADVNRTLWGGFVIEGGGVSVYHAGDSAAFDGFAEIGRRFPGLAAALLPVGAYAPGWFMERFHMNPEQAGQAFLACGARRFLPTHWGAFQLSDEALCEPVPRVRAWWAEHDPRDGRELIVPAVGQTVDLGD